MARAMTAQMPDALSESPDLAPSMTDVLKRTALKLEDEVRREGRQGDDRADGRRPPPTGAILVPDKPWLKVPR